ncbi:MAG: TorF family putative porin [Bacteroidota bacterium]
MKRVVAMFRTFILAGLLLLSATSLFAQLQDENKMDEKSGNSAAFSVGTDVVSRYIWRGADYGNSPAVQPSVAFSVAGFKAGFWGSYGLGHYSKQLNDSTVLDLGNYAEFDFYLSYTLKGFTLMAYDYFLPNPLDPNNHNKYFNFKNSTTGHTVEVCLSWAGPEKFPLQLYAGTLVYGDDKRKNNGSKNNFSTYFEAAYQFSVKGFGVKPFIGAIPVGSGWYGPYAGVVNAGLTISKPITITKDFSLPVTGSIITNPQSQSVFLVFGISL